MNKRMTLVFEWEEGQEQPRISAGTTFEGGKCVAVQFSDALEELEKALGELKDMKYKHGSKP